MVKFSDEKENKTEKMGIDDYLNNYNNEDFQELMNQSKKEKTKEEKLADLVKPISSVKYAKSYEWIVPNMFARQYVSFLFGEAGCGKTWIILDLSIKLTSGMPVFNGIEIKPQKVLLFEGDTNDVLIKERIFKLSPNISDNFIYINRYKADEAGIEIDLTSEKGRNNIENIIFQQKPDLIIFDTLISYITDEKDAVEMKNMIDFLRTVANKWDCHILLCHHSRKRESKERKDKLHQSDLIGSSVLNRLASFILGAENKESIDDFDCLNGVLSTKKSWFAPIKPIAYKIEDTDENSVKIIYETSAEEKSNSHKAIEKIREYVKANNYKSFSRKVVVSRFSDIPETAIKKALKLMLDNGLLIASGTTKNRIYEPIPPNIEPK